MTKEKKREHYASYHPIHYRSRFWLYSEACYTDDELNQRVWMLKTRANSGIHPDYLANPSSWFADDSQALINVYENSWFYTNAYKTRHVLTRDDFHVQPIDSQRIQWPRLYDLMQRTGDYLLLRNQELSEHHLNQPMNFFLLDLNNILKGISQNPNIKQTQEQLELLTRYIRTVEKNISPFVGSDRLFLANFRSVIEEDIQPELTHSIESQLLRDRLSDLSKSIKQLSIERNRILHFALNINPVNPHPYDFAIDKPQDLAAYPTQAVKECAKTSTEVMDNSMSLLKITIQQLSECPHFKLIDMQDQILEYYAQAISDLNELDQFQKVISQTIDLLGQAGEVYTIYQFKEQLSLLLQQIEHFIDTSAIPIEEIIHENTQAYHKAIQEEQNLSLLTKWFTSEREKLTHFIRNQDTLAQFPSTTVDLLKTSQTLKEQVGHLMTHLNKPQKKESNFAAIAEKAQELNTLLHSMHRFVKVQYEIKGLEPPKPPENLKFLTQSSSQLMNEQSSFIDYSCRSTFFYEHSFSLTPKPQPFSITNYPALSFNKNQESTHFDNSLYASLILLIPVGLLVFYFFYRSQNKPEIKTKFQGNKEKYEKLKVQLDDLIVKIQKEQNDEMPQNTLADFKKKYAELDHGAKQNDYDYEELSELYQDVKFFYKEYFNIPTAQKWRQLLSN